MFAKQNAAGPPDTRQTGNQSSWKMNSIHYHDVKSCVVATGEKYKLHQMLSRATAAAHFLCETPAARQGVVDPIYTL